MSMPRLYLKCGACSKEWALGSLVGRSSYQLPNKHLVQLNKTMAWCYSCGHYSPVEKMESKEGLNEKLDSLLNNVAEERKSINPFVLFIFRLLGKQPSERLHDIQHEIHAIRSTLRFLDHRLSSPKCLTCGSMHVNQKSAFEEPEYHPNCGGKVKSHEDSDLRIIFRPQHRIYDVEGRFLRINKS